MHNGPLGTRGLKLLGLALLLTLNCCNPEKQWQGLEITGHLPDFRFSVMSDTGQPATDQTFQGYLALFFSVSQT
jgi:protein SCO1/2